VDAEKSKGLSASRRNRKSVELAERKVTGTYLELTEQQFPPQREHALEKLAQYSQYWKTPLAERREQTSDLSIEPVFFRIDIGSMSGLHAIPETE
jgi:nitroimidazol reductase NimA-like FMN-containing flavoprotein (pyridoxamine 5'-phosphate oxidase superfamily)